ncbi:MAG TPA: hypothetical protein VHW73_14125, partial [Rudaea sp.]|nr:hypothetical protein [Rudaea sp.]
MKKKSVSGATRPTLIALVMSVVFSAGCDHAPHDTAQASASAPVKHDVVADNIDTAVNPGDDFFSFAN